MKPLFSVLALWSLLAVPVLAQTASWQKVAGSLTSDVPSIVFTSNDTGYMLEQTGSTMTIVKTMNGGQSFSGLPVPAVGTVTGVTNMCWPTANDGFVACATSSGTKLLVTHNAGASWNESTASSSESFNFLSFPTASVGYASGSKIPSGSGYFVAKTTDGGSNWTTVYTNTNTIGSLDFHTAMDGIIFVDDNSQVPQLAYTFDGLESAPKMAAAFASDIATDYFLHWNDDNSWILGYEGIQRSSDSGKTWTRVVESQKNDISYGDIVSACFYHRRGFAFSESKSVVFETLNYGITWSSTTTSPNILNESSAVCSMPSYTKAYVFGIDSAAEADNLGGPTNGMLLTASLPADTTHDPGAGVASLPTAEQFSLDDLGSTLLFHISPSTHEQTIEIYDLLGREYFSIPLAPNAGTATLTKEALPPGIYFARVGRSVLKVSVDE